jgi:hypothetical protein
MVHLEYSYFRLKCPSNLRDVLRPEYLRDTVQPPHYQVMPCSCCTVWLSSLMLQVYFTPYRWSGVTMTCELLWLKSNVR